MHLLKLLPRDAHGRILPAPEKLQKEKRLTAAARRGVCKPDRQEFNVPVCLDPDFACQTSATMKSNLTKMWPPHAIELPVPEPVTDSNAGCCRTTHSEASYNYFADVLLVQPEANNDSQRVNRWNVPLAPCSPAPKGCESSRVALVAPASSETRIVCYHYNTARVFALALPPADCEQAAQLAVVLCYGFEDHSQ